MAHTENPSPQPTESNDTPSNATLPKVQGTTFNQKEHDGSMGIAVDAVVVPPVKG